VYQIALLQEMIWPTFISEVAALPG
jgi:hypothetical protein